MEPSWHEHPAQINTYADNLDNEKTMKTHEKSTITHRGERAQRASERSERSERSDSGAPGGNFAISK